MNKFHLANYIALRYQDSVTPMKLQKLLYYCYVWQLVASDKKFDASFEAWTYGPVEPEIYNAYKKFGKKPVQADKDSIISAEPLLDFIMDSYAVYSAIELSKTTHLESPWKKYRDTGEVIPDDELLAFYTKQPYAKNFPIEEDKIFYPPKTSSHYSFTFDMEKEYVPIFDNLEEYLTAFKKENKRLLDIMSTHHELQN